MPTTTKTIEVTQDDIDRGIGEAFKFIRDFDAGRAVKPFSFTLEYE